MRRVTLLMEIPVADPLHPDVQAFAAALRAERARRRLTQADLAELVGVTDARISQLENGDHPSPDLVFRLERSLDLPAGRLSAHLGYVPAGAVPGLVDAINADPNLDDVGRDAVRRVYEAVVNHPKQRRH
jgi:transcriptional regulator with XRE-family HTH domain